MVTLRDPALVRRLTPGRSTALGGRLLHPGDRVPPASPHPRQGSHQDGGYPQKVNTIRIAIRIFGPADYLSALAAWVVRLPERIGIVLRCESGIAVAVYLALAICQRIGAPPPGRIQETLQRHG